MATAAILKNQNYTKKPQISTDLREILSLNAEHHILGLYILEITMGYVIILYPAKTQMTFSFFKYSLTVLKTLLI